VVDPKAVSYGVENPIYAVVQLAQTTMRSELGKITLDKTFEERDTLNAKIVAAINEASQEWGLQCLRYEIRDITPPRAIQQAMEMQAEAERRKRAAVLQSEGEKESAVNFAEGRKQQMILESEAAKIDAINRAEGEAEAIFAKAEAHARGIEAISASLQSSNSSQAVQMQLASQYINAFGNVAKQSTTMLLPAGVGDPASMVATAMGVVSALGGSSGGGANGGTTVAAPKIGVSGSGVESNSNSVNSFKAEASQAAAAQAKERASKSSMPAEFAAAPSHPLETSPRIILSRQ